MHPNTDEAHLHGRVSKNFRILFTAVPMGNIVATGIDSTLYFNLETFILDALQVSYLSGTCGAPNRHSIFYDRC
jgi:hypothetical protein